MTREVEMATRIKTVELNEVFGDTINDGGKWQLLCTKHWQCVQYTNKRVAASWKNSPEEWCESCQDDKHFCYTCDFPFADYLVLDDGTVIGHEGHEIGGRN
jgi:hypothetical protein